jgi:hypothetical protein
LTLHRERLQVDHIPVVRVEVANNVRGGEEQDSLEPGASLWSVLGSYRRKRKAFNLDLSVEESPEKDADSKAA